MALSNTYDSSEINVHVYIDPETFITQFRLAFGVYRLNFAMDHVRLIEYRDRDTDYWNLVVRAAFHAAQNAGLTDPQEILVRVRDLILDALHRGRLEVEQDVQPIRELGRSRPTLMNVGPPRVSDFDSVAMGTTNSIGATRMTFNPEPVEYSMGVKPKDKWDKLVERMKA
jgi:hypothetical protein